MHLYNYPRFVPPEQYDAVIEKVVAQLRSEAGVVAVFQLGGVGAPGISDIDLLVVFEDGATCRHDAYRVLSKEERYLCTHGAFGLSRRHFYEAQRFTRYHGYRLRWGEALDPEANAPARDFLRQLQRQIALEFLLANYMARRIEAAYGLVSVRNLLLSVHALRYDLEFLEITSGRFYELVHDVIEWRQRWFKAPVGQRQLKAWLEVFNRELHTSLSALLAEYPLYLPVRPDGSYTRHIRLRRAPALGVERSGLVLPALGLIGKKGMRLQNRLNTFEFGVPVEDAPEGSAYRERFDFLRRVRQEQQASYPAYLPLLNNLLYKLI